MNLGPGEQVIFEGHPSWRAILGFYIKGILIVGVDRRPDRCSSPARLGDGGPAILIVSSAPRSSSWSASSSRVATDYTITNRRLHIKHGIISRDVQETKIERVQDVNYSQSLYQRIMQIGDVDFDTAARTDESDFVFAGRRQPRGGRRPRPPRDRAAGSAAPSLGPTETRDDSGLGD